MNVINAFLVSAATSLAGTLAVAQTSVAEWSFGNTTAGTVDNISVSNFSTGLSVSNLTSSGGTSTYGVINNTFGATQAVGSGDFDGAAFQVGMDTTPNTQNPESNGFALNFNITVGVGQTLELSSFQFDLGYDTNFATSNPNYYAPFAQLYVSTDGTSWIPAGGSLTPDISDESIFSTGAGSGGVYYIEESLSADLTSSTVAGSLEEGTTIYFRLALSDVGSGSDRRRIIVDNINLNGSLTAIPEASTYALIGGLMALTGALIRRRK